MLRGKERKNRYAKLNGARWRRFIYIKDLVQVEKNSRKHKGIHVEKYNRFKKLKIEIIKTKLKRKGKLHRTAKTQHRGRGL